MLSTGIFTATRSDLSSNRVLSGLMALSYHYFKVRHMSSITLDLAEVLGGVRRPGDFFVSGTAELLAPRLEVEGVGIVALPLIEMQAKQLIAAARRAPFGRGADTIVDTSVRRTWQIGAENVRIGGKHWVQTLAGILDRVTTGLGVAEPVTAEFYKLLVYDEGSFFVGHRDTEKVPGMFATLVIVLPSISSGGQLLVRHKGREARLELACEDPSEASFAAFYADCVHEVLPVTSGYRLALVYNILRAGKVDLPKPPDYAREEARVVALLQCWTEGQRGAASGLDGAGDTPAKIVFPLEHAYSSAELGFDRLKGADAAVAGVLRPAASVAGCDLHLALLSIEESGAAEYAEGYGGYRGRRSGPEFEAGEVFERSEILSHWHRPDDTHAALGALPVEAGEVSPPDAFEELVPDEEEFSEATGNEGASFERSYQRAALVLWPSAAILAVLNQAGLPATLPYLGELAARWAASGEKPGSPLWRQAHELAGHMLSTWPRQPYYRQDKEPSIAAKMLYSLTMLQDSVEIDRFAGDILVGGWFGKADNPAIAAALALLDGERAKSLVESILARNTASAPGTCASLLARAAALPHCLALQLKGAGDILLALLPGNPAKAAPSAGWPADRSIGPAVLIDLMTAMAQIDPALAERTAHYLLAWPKIWDIDTVLVAGVQGLPAEIRDNAAVRLLHQACVAHLQARIAEPLAPPPDWRRASKLGCACEKCTSLRNFLTDPGQQKWVFRAAQTERSHVETTIANARVDLNTTTLRSGSPHSLVCTKNQASYERRVVQRREDMENLEKLGV